MKTRAGVDSPGDRWREQQPVHGEPGRAEPGGRPSRRQEGRVRDRRRRRPLLGRGHGREVVAPWRRRVRARLHGVARALPRPARGQEGIFGGMQKGVETVFSTVSTTTTFASGAVTKTDTTNIYPALTLNLDALVYPNLRLNAGGVLELNRQSTRSLFGDTDSTITRNRPFFLLRSDQPGVLSRDRLFQAGGPRQDGRPVGCQARQRRIRRVPGMETGRRAVSRISSSSGRTRSTAIGPTRTSRRTSARSIRTTPTGIWVPTTAVPISTRTTSSGAPRRAR